MTDPLRSKSEALLDVDPDEELDAGLEFQSYSSTSQTLGKMKMQSAPSTTQPSPKQQTPQIAITVDEPTSAEVRSQNKPFWTVDYYAQFFDIDTPDIKNRIFATLLPKPYFFDLVSAAPDLYGPFWISTTLIMLVFVTGTLRNALYVKQTGQFNYPFEQIGVCASIVYSYITLVPLGVWFLIKYWTGLKIKLVEIMCTYGYAMTIWCLCLLVTIHKAAWLFWIVGFVGFGWSSLFFVRNYYAMFNTAQGATFTAVDGTATTAEPSLAKRMSTGTIILLIMLGTWFGFLFVFIFALANSEMAQSK